MLAVVGLFAPLHDPNAQNFQSRLVAPNQTYVLGTDHLGRDLLARVLAGASTTLSVGILSTLACCVLGVVLGGASGWSGHMGTLVGTALDTIQAFPPFLMTMLLATVFRPSYWTLVLAIGFAYCPIVARGLQIVVRTQRTQDYVLASAALGQTPFGIARRHILPNAIPTLIVLATSILSVAILTEAGLSFLGLGSSSAAASWGRMVFDARPYMERAPQTALVPLSAISLVIIASNVLGDYLHEVLDPRMGPRRGAA